ncbi:MAG: RluA family pseudouridine synthase, partial [Verrucomicrobiales bacterium]
MPNQGGETRHFVVPSEDRGKRLDQVLAAQYDDLSRARCQSLIRAGHLILKEEVCVDPAYKLRGGEPLSLTLPTVSPTMLEPEDRSLDIVFEDETLLVLNKPPNLVVHPGAGHQQGTLVHALLHHCKGQLSGIGGVERPGIVHRLDKDT